ncbi:MAG: phage tail spike protein [Oscillospiraceae bacterium]
MIVYFADRRLNVLGQASTKLPTGLVITDDTKTEDIETGVAIFECEIRFDKNTRNKANSCTEVGNYILRTAGDGISGKGNEFYTIMESEIDTQKQTIYIYAEDAGMDLLNEVFGAYTADKSYPISHYLNKYAAGSGFKIGINEASALTRKLSWDGEATATERIASVATQFDGCEVSYSFAVQGLIVTDKYINIYRHRGKDIGIQLRLNQDIDRIITNKNITKLATALQCTGGTPEKSETPITLKSYKYDDGDFYVDGEILKSRVALERWGRYLWKKENSGEIGVGGHIVKPYSFDTINQSTLCSHAITHLKKICDMEVNYEVNIVRLPENAKIGDRVTVIDDAGELYLSTRILALEVSEIRETQKATLGEYLIRDSGISERVEELAKQFSEVAKNRIFYTWTVYADDTIGTGITTNPADKEYLGIAVNQLKENPDLSKPSIYTWSKIKGENGTDSVTLQILSSNGVLFKNSLLATTLTITVIAGNTTICSYRELVEKFGNTAKLLWEQKQLGEQIFTKLDAGDRRLSDNGFILTLSPKDVCTQTVFNCSLDI